MQNANLLDEIKKTSTHSSLGAYSRVDWVGLSSAMEENSDRIGIKSLPV